MEKNYQLVNVVDPRFKLRWCSEEENIMRSFISDNTDRFQQKLKKHVISILHYERIYRDQVQETFHHKGRICSDLWLSKL